MLALLVLQGCVDRIEHRSLALTDGGTADGGPPCSAAWPGADNTGWEPTGVQLSPYTGPSTITEPGTVIDGADITSCLTLAADQVLLRRSRVRTTGRCGDDALVQIADRSGSGQGGYQGILIEDVELDGVAQPAATGISGSGFTARRVNLHRVGQGVHLLWTQPTVVEDSWIHGLVVRYDDSSNAVVSNGSAHAILRRNRLENALAANAVVALFGDWAPIDDVLLESNLLEGGGYSLYGGSSPGKPFSVASRIRVVGNCWGRSHFPNGGYYGPVRDFALDGVGNEWTDNRWADTTLPILP